MNKAYLNIRTLLMAYLGIVLVYGWCFYSAPNMYLDVVIHADRASAAEVYYAGPAEAFSQERSSRHTYPQGESRLLLPINQKSISALRFDPSQSDNKVTVTRLRVVDRVGVILEKVAIDTVRAGNQMAEVSATNGTLVLAPVAGATDPFVFLDIGQGLASSDHAGSPWVELTLVFLLGVFLWRKSSMSMVQPALGIYPAMLTAVFCIVFVAAVLMITSRSVNPDETMHIGAARFYLDNWLPPAIGDLRVVSDPDAYAAWGLSYLDEWDICYFLAGKFAVVLSPFVADETIRFRLFDALMLFVLIRVCLTRRWALPLAPLLLISPQVWYVFSYFNGDAFALATAGLAVFYLADRSFLLFDDSAAGRSIWRDLKDSWRRYLPAALLISLVLLSKRNYWSVLPFIGLIWLSRAGIVNWLGVIIATIALLSFSAFTFESQYSFSKEYLDTFFAIFCTSSILFFISQIGLIYLRPDIIKTIFRIGARAAVIVILALCISAPRIGWDRLINGDATEKAEKLVQNENHYAADFLKPSTIKRGQGLTTSRLQDRGYSVGSLFAPALNWQGKTVTSFFGAYGYVEYVTPSVIIVWLFALAAVLFGLSLWQAMRVEGFREGLVILAMSAVVIGNSVLASWINGFQPQGRYLFALLPFAALHLNALRPATAATGTRALVACSATLGIYSFLYYGLPNLIR